MAAVTISTSNTSARYETLIDSASADALTVSGSNVGVKAEGIVATGANHAAILVTGDSVSITATLIHSGSYDSIIANSTSGNVSVTAERMSAFANCIETNGGSPTVCVRANEIESGEGVNFESTGGSVFIDCNRIVIPSADLVNSSATTAELNIRANYIECNGISGTSGLTIRITDAIIDSAITISAGTLELRNCVCLGAVTQSSTGVVRYDGNTQFRSTTTGTLTAIGTLFDIEEKTNLITSQNVFVTTPRVVGQTITMYQNESTTTTVDLEEDTTSKTLRFVVEDPYGVDVLVIEDASITTTTTSFTVTITTAVTASLGQYKWALRDITGGTINRLVSTGVLSVQGAPNKDA